MQNKVVNSCVIERVKYPLYVLLTLVMVMVFNTTFNNISLIIMAVSFIRVPGKNTNLVPVTDKLYHIMLYPVHFAWVGFELTTLVVIGTDCIDGCISNYYTITYLLWYWNKECISFLLSINIHTTIL
jgi:hypothetical protein